MAEKNLHKQSALWDQTEKVLKCFSFLGYPPENERMSPKKGSISKGKWSSNQHFSGDMFLFGGVKVVLSKKGIQQKSQKVDQQVFWGMLFLWLWLSVLLCLLFSKTSVSLGKINPKCSMYGLFAYIRLKMATFKGKFWESIDDVLSTCSNLTTCCPLKRAPFRKGKDRLPTTIFQGQCFFSLPGSTNGNKHDNYCKVYWFFKK